MTHKLRQQLPLPKQSLMHKLPATRASQFVLNYMRIISKGLEFETLRSVQGVLNWRRTKQAQRTGRPMFRAACPITGRSRGTSRRFTVARTRIKSLAGQGRLFGLRKSSW